MKQISLDQFNKLTPKEIEREGSAELTVDGVPVCVVVVGAIGGMRHRLEGMVSLINANRPQETAVEPPDAENDNPVDTEIYVSDKPKKPRKKRK